MWPMPLFRWCQFAYLLWLLWRCYFGNFMHIFGCEKSLIFWLLFNMFLKFRQQTNDLIETIQANTIENVVRERTICIPFYVYIAMKRSMEMHIYRWTFTPFLSCCNVFSLWKYIIENFNTLHCKCSQFNCVLSIKSPLKLLKLNIM